MNLVAIVSMVNELAGAVSALGWSLSEVTALQQQAEKEGRELSVEDFKALRDGARQRLDTLEQAIADAEALEAARGG